MLVAPPDLMSAPGRCRFGGKPADVLAAGGVGIAATVNIRIPDNAPTGFRVPIAVQVGDFSTPDGSTLAVNSADGTALNLSDLSMEPEDVLSGMDLRPKKEIVPGDVLMISRPQNFPWTDSLNASGSGIAPVEMQGVRVLFDGVPAPLVHRTPQAIEVMVPWELAGQSSTKIQMQYNDDTGAPLSMPVVQVHPSLVMWLVEGSMRFQNSPSEDFFFLGGSPRTFARGQELVFSATGTGPMSPAGITGSLNPPAASVTLPVSVTIGGKPAPILYAGSNTDPFFGLFTKFAVGIPPDAPEGDNIPVVLTVGGVSSGESASITIQ